MQSITNLPKILLPVAAMFFCFSLPFCTSMQYVCKAHLQPHNVDRQVSFEMTAPVANSGAFERHSYTERDIYAATW